MIAEDWAPGITNYTTGGHGGVGLTEKRAAELRYHANFDSDGRTSPSSSLFCRAICTIHKWHVLVYIEGESNPSK
jgi:hypothetical protein